LPHLLYHQFYDKKTLRLKPYGQPAASFLPHLQTRENEACVQWGN
jgi:hypothetical protein